MLQPGDTLGEYRIEGVLGRGGMATVYSAHQGALARTVAIKVLPEFLAEEPGFRERFRQEAIAIAGLRHPAIVVVFDYGEQGGTPYLVGEYIENGTLADRLGAPLLLPEAVRLLAPIAAALDFAHERGVIHRDVKPANILIGRDGGPVLSDFGLAKLLGGNRHLTQTGMVLGTPHYMAPEIASGDAMGPSVDRYALAVIAYEMLTGTVPFDAETPQSLLLLHLQQPAPPPSARNPALSPAVEAVLLRGLAKSPEARYPSAAAFVQALGEAAAAPAADPTVLLPARPRARHVWWPAKIGAALLALAVVGGAVAVYETRSTAQSPRLASGSWTAAGSIDAPAAFAQAARLPGGNALVVGGYGPDENGRGADEYDAARRAWVTLPAMPVPRSRFTATVLADGTILVAGGDTGTTFTATAQIFDPRRRAWRAAGSLRIARRSHAAVRLRNGEVLVVGGEDPRYAPLRAAELYNPVTGAWSATGSTASPHYGDTAVLLANGTVLLVGGGTSACELYDPGTGQWRPAASMRHSRLGHTLTLLRDGRVLAAGGAGDTDSNDQASAEIYDPKTNTWAMAAAMQAPRTLHTATLLGDGTVLVAGGRDGARMLASAERFDPATGRWTLAASMHERRSQQVAVTIAGGAVLIAGGIAGADAYLGTAEIYRTP